jgi:hypothetical protein
MSAEVEHPGVLEEELAFLWEEQAELREVHLLLVGLRLREIGPHREVQRERGSDAVLRVEPDVLTVVESAAAHRARRVGRDPRFEPQVMSLARVGKTAQRARQAGPIQVPTAVHFAPFVRDL